MMKKNGFTLIEVMIVVALLGILSSIVFARIGFVTLFPDYSIGERTGVIVKLSKKGLVFKTWEGQMNIGSMSSDGNGVAVPTVFEFSAKDPLVIEELKKSAASGKRTTVSYHQALMRSIKDGESQYLVEAVRHE